MSAIRERPDIARRPDDRVGRLAPLVEGLGGFQPFDQAQRLPGNIASTLRCNSGSPKVWRLR